MKLKAGNYYTAEELATKLGKGRMTIYRWLRAGKIKGMYIGDLLRFYEKDVEPFLQIKKIEDKLPIDKHGTK